MSYFLLENISNRFGTDKKCFKTKQRIGTDRKRSYIQMEMEMGYKVNFGDL